MKDDAEIELYIRSKCKSAILKSATSRYEKKYQSHKPEPTVWAERKAIEHSLINNVIEIIDELGESIRPQKVWRIAVETVIEIHPRIPKKPDHFVHFILPRCKKEGIESYLLNMLISMNNSKNARKYSDEHIDLIKGYYIKNRQATAIDVYRQLEANHYGDALSYLSHSTVKRIIRENKHTWDPLKYPELVREQEKKAVLISSANPLTQLQIDGSTLAYPYWDENSKEIKQLVFFIVVDDHSNKVIGWSVDESENIVMIMDAIKMALMIEGNVAGYNGVLPGEFKSDNASPFYTPRWNVFKELCAEYGKTEFTKQRAGKPTGKSEVEFVVKRVQEMLKFDEGMIGLSVKSISRTSRKHDSEIAELRKKKNLPSRSYVIDRITYAIDQFNSLAVAGKKSPNDLFANLDRPFATPLELPQMVNLFWHRAKAKVRPSGQFSFKYRNTAYYYEITQQDLQSLSKIRAGKGAGKGEHDIIVRFDYSPEGEFMKTVYCYDYKSPTRFLFNATEQPKQRKAVKERTLYDKGLSDQLDKENRMVANGYRQERQAFDMKSLESNTNYQMGKDVLKKAQDSLLREQFADRYKGSDLVMEKQTTSVSSDETVTKVISKFKKPTLLE